MTNELAVIESKELSCVEEYAMTPERILMQVKLIQTAMQSAMKEGTHYGIIPGCDKPSLWKPGAEKLSMMFRIAPSYEVIETDMARGHKDFSVTCSLTHIPTGQFLGQGIGSCSTMESKFRYRKMSRICPECGKEAIIKGQAQYGGGWVCYKKKGGCGCKWDDGAEVIENQQEGRVEYENPADYYNTCRKMAKKRAQVDATLTATAASDIFTQDMEDIKANLEVIADDTPKAQEKPASPVPPKTTNTTKPAPAQPKASPPPQSRPQAAPDGVEVKPFQHFALGSAIGFGKKCPEKLWHSEDRSERVDSNYLTWMMNNVRDRDTNQPKPEAEMAAFVLQYREQLDLAPVEGDPGMPLGGGPPEFNDDDIPF